MNGYWLSGGGGGPGGPPSFDLWADKFGYAASRNFKSNTPMSPANPGSLGVWQDSFDDDPNHCVLKRDDFLDGGLPVSLFILGVKGIRNTLDATPSLVVPDRLFFDGFTKWPQSGFSSKHAAKSCLDYVISFWCWRDDSFPGEPIYRALGDSILSPALMSLGLSRTQVFVNQNFDYPNLYDGGTASYKARGGGAGVMKQNKHYCGLIGSGGSTPSYGDVEFILNKVDRSLGGILLPNYVDEDRTLLTGFSYNPDIRLSQGYTSQIISQTSGILINYEVAVPVGGYQYYALPPTYYNMKYVSNTIITKKFSAYGVSPELWVDTPDVNILPIKATDWVQGWTVSKFYVRPFTAKAYLYYTPTEASFEDYTTNYWCRAAYGGVQNGN